MRRRRTVLIVESESPLRDMYRVTLEIGGYQVLTAPDEEEAAEILKRNPALSLVLLDRLPLKNGRSFLDRLRDNPHTKNIPVVVASSFAETAGVAHPQAFLSKPVAPMQLLRVVKDFAT